MSDSTTHCIYRIVCFQNTMVYIGQTLDPKKRKRVHFQQLRDNQHINVHLQASYNKYGRQAFYFEVIERDIQSTDVDEREQYWIDHYDCFRNGFNRTPGGNRVGGSYKPIVWNGVWYESVSECERILGVSMKWRIAQGYTSDEQLKPPGKRVPCTWDGITYPSYAACARALGLDTSTVQDYIRRGYTCASDIKQPPQPCVWNDVQYPSIAAAAKACGIAPTNMAIRIRKGYTCDADIPKRISNAKKTPCTWNGKQYPSISDAARANGLQVTALHYRLRQGYTCDDDMK